MHFPLFPRPFFDDEQRIAALGMFKSLFPLTISCRKEYPAKLEEVYQRQNALQ